MALDNQDLLNVVRESSSQQYQDVVPLADGTNTMEIFATLESYPTAKNEFINTLTNRIGKQLFFDKVFNNPLKMLHKGMLPYGKSIEQLFTEMAEEKGFNEHFNGSTSQEGDLIKVTPPSIKPDYITQNFEYKFKTAISDLQLAGAFTSQYGLSEVITRAVNSLLSSSQYAEFRDMKKILNNEEVDATGGSTIGKGLIQQIVADDTLKLKAIQNIGTTLDGKKLAKLVRTYASKFTFPSTDYNLAGVKTWSQKEDLVLFVTPEVQADLDVEVLAYAFNVSSADVNVRTIVVDDLGQTEAGTNVVAILADKDIIQSYDTINTTSTFYNPERITTNYFAHKHGIMAGCKFANAIIFTVKPSV